MKTSEIKNFYDLIVWQKSFTLAEHIYRETRTGPFSTDYGLRDQIRRAAVSIMSNIAEGHGRYSKKEYSQFISIANGSTNEVRAQLMLCAKLGYIKQETADELISRSFEISKMLKVLRRKLQ
jgi:four helix bundle protein